MKKKDVKIPKKRFFSLVDAPLSSFKRITRSKTIIGQTKKTEDIDYFSIVPEYIIKEILSFLKVKYLFNLKLLNHEFHCLVSQMFTIINFSNKRDIPLNFLQLILKSCSKPKTIYFGELKNITASDFLERVLDLLFLKDLKNLNFSSFSELNDEILLKIFEKINCELLNSLNLPYSCNMTSKSLVFFANNLKNLEFFSIDSKHSIHENTNLNQATIAKIVNNNEGLLYVKIEMINVEFLKSLDEANFKSNQLQYLKLRNLELNKLEDIKNISVFGFCVNLIEFTIKEIFVNKKLIIYNNQDIQESFENLFKKMNSLKKLSLGHFTTPNFLDIISETLINLDHFKVVSEALEIEDIENFFFNSLNLRKISGQVGVEYNAFCFEKKRVLLFF